MPASNAFRWFAEAMRLWKRSPVVFCLQAFVILAVTVLPEPVPVLGFVAANVVAPLLSCGLLYSSLAADRDGKARLLHLFAVFAAPLSAQWAAVAAGLVVLAAEGTTAWALADVNLLFPVPDAAGLSPGAIMGIYAVGVLASLPVTFVPMAALFDGEDWRRAFVLSWRAFAANVPPFLALAAYSYVLLVLGLATTGVGLVLALPWIAAASYAAWKDIYRL
ncbi:MAG: hypothetical protein U1F10_05905 [Burkholderiales bacterium]